MEKTTFWSKLFNENTTNCASLGRRIGEDRLDRSGGQITRQRTRLSHTGRPRIVSAMAPTRTASWQVPARPAVTDGSGRSYLTAAARLANRIRNLGYHVEIRAAA